jgi:hypothetical protein
MNYRIIENYLPQKQADEIESFMINPPYPQDPAPTFPWYYMPHPTDNKLSQMPFFTHVFYDHIGQQKDIYFDGINKTILNRLEQEDMKDMSLLRVRANLYLRNPKPMFSEPHRDHFIDHKVAIYYVNTNDGYTLLNEKIKIPSIKNSVLIFDGGQHRAVSQTDEKVRVIINISYK